MRAAIMMRVVVAEMPDLTPDELEWYAAEAVRNGIEDTLGTVSNLDIIDITVTP